MVDHAVQNQKFGLNQTDVPLWLELGSARNQWQALTNVQRQKHLTQKTSLNSSYQVKRNLLKYSGYPALSTSNWANGSDFYEVDWDILSCGLMIKSITISKIEKWYHFQF